MSEVDYGQKSKWPLLAFISLVLIAGLIFLMTKMSSKTAELSKDELVIYCAAGIKLPILEITNSYTKEFGIPIRLEFGSSGELEAKLQWFCWMLELCPDSSHNPHGSCRGSCFVAL